ncbi:hypothetical protein [Emticicia sp. BO119]|uniref:hypothetical protein n=1 Tax=Emticicia sp. BO119 TaxID=2757768 RepID=UPI0015F05B2D|nr:hypothetical protein [Emticicia sp. BO119]MBA4849458.1 hypothetical protein [Emticicia sp. BO119]
MAHVITEQVSKQIKDEFEEILKNHGIEEYMFLISDGRILAQEASIKEGTLIGAIATSIENMVSETCVILPPSRKHLN